MGKGLVGEGGKLEITLVIVIHTLHHIQMYMVPLASTLPFSASKLITMHKNNLDKLRTRLVTLSLERSGSVW